jgi:asparagine synthase (glutamine-hydrolysing)
MSEIAGVFDCRASQPLRLVGATSEECSGACCRLSGFAVERAGDAGSPRTERELIGLHRRWRSELPQRLAGEYALLVWDSEGGGGLLARDRLGVGCIYLHERGGLLHFASELHALLKLLPRTPQPDRASVGHWLAASARPGASTLYEGIERLDPGTTLLLSRTGWERRSYWRPRWSPARALGREEAGELVRPALAGAVRRRLDTTGPTGVLMSGGLDSASVAALAASGAGAEVRAYSGVFPDHPSVDESGLIGELRTTLALPGLDAAVTAGGLVASAAEWAARCAVPQLGWSDCWTLPLLRGAAEDGVGVLLGGDGGDELFGAQTGLIADAVRSGHPLRSLSLARELPGAGDRPGARQLLRVWMQLGLPAASPAWAARAAQAARPGRGLPGWIRADCARAVTASDDSSVWRELDGPRWWAQAAHGLTRGIEERGIFEHQRLRAAMAGVQARHPLLDTELLELMLTLPPELSFDRHLSRPLLRDAMAGMLPDSVRLRARKAWFDELVIDAMTSADATAIRALLCAPDAEIGSWVDLPAARTMLECGPPPGGGRFAWMHAVWRLLSVECWLRTLAGRPLPPASSAAVQMLPRRPSRPAASSVFQS